MNKRIIVIGSGGHAKSVIEVIESMRKFEIMGLIGLKEEVNQKILGYKVIGSDDDLVRLREICSNSFIGIGQIKSSQKRLIISNKLKELDFVLKTIVASTAMVSNYSDIKSGTFIGHGAIVNAGAKIGENCIINSKALIEHDSQIGDFCHISTGALINGGVEVGDHSFIGSGTIIKEGIRLPEGTIISAGKTILRWPL